MRAPCAHWIESRTKTGPLRLPSPIIRCPLDTSELDVTVTRKTKVCGLWAQPKYTLRAHTVPATPPLMGPYVELFCHVA